jgi:C-terminal processing protease CtpA/Prc
LIWTAFHIQVFDNTPAAKDGTLQSGDELVGVNGASVKGMTKVEVAKIIQTIKVRSIETFIPLSESKILSLKSLSSSH